MDTNSSKKEGAGTGTTSRTGQKSPSIDYNNYFANAQQVQIAVPDNFDGEEGAASENYYAAEVLNLHFNPNSRTRFGIIFAFYFYNLSISQSLRLSVYCYSL